MSNTCGLICVPLKRAADIDVSKPLNSVIKSNYSTSVNFKDRLAELQKLRQAAIKADSCEAGAIAIAKYLDQIISLERRIPAEEVKISFRWHDAFKKGNASIQSLAFERTSIMFNLAASSSGAAAEQNLDDPESLQKAMKRLQLSAGIFLHLQKQTFLALKSGDLTQDFSADNLGVLADLMVAQAQEMVVAKALRDKMKPGIVAKLCSLCGELYGALARSMERESVKGILDAAWLNTAKGKQALYQGLAQFHQAKVCNDSKVVGEEIARLECAKTLLATVTSISSSNSNLCDVKEWSRQTEKYLETANRDNDMIYHEQVADKKTLEPIAKAAVVAKATDPLPDTFSQESSQDLFEELGPDAMRKEGCVIS